MSDVLMEGFMEGAPWETDPYEIDPHCISGIQDFDGDVHIDPEQQ